MSDHPDVKIRLATAADAPALKAIFLDTFESTWRPELTPEAVAAYFDGPQPDAFIASHGHEFHLAERAGEVMGLVHWTDDFVNALHVRSDHSRSGTGGRLMDVAEAAIAASGHAAARLETDTFNARSQSFYAARGYKEAGRYPDEEWKSGLTTLLLVKSLR